MVIFILLFIVKLNELIIKNCMAYAMSVLLYHACLLYFFVYGSFHPFSQIGDIFFHLYDYLLG